jgi:hypothetical protein
MLRKLAHKLRSTQRHGLYRTSFIAIVFITEAYFMVPHLFDPVVTDGHFPEQSSGQVVYTGQGTRRLDFGSSWINLAFVITISFLL